MIPQVLIIFDPKKSSEPTIQIVARHEIAGGVSLIGDAHIPFGSTLFSDINSGLGGTLIAGDELGFEFTVDLRRRGGASVEDGADLQASRDNNQLARTKGYTLFTQSHVRAEVSVPYFLSRVQGTLGAEQVHVNKYDLQSATGPRVRSIVQQVVGENVAGAAAAAAAMYATSSPSLAHLLGIAGKSFFRNTVAISPPTAKTVYHQNHFGPFDLNSSLVGESWIPEQGATPQSAGFAVNVYTRIQSPSANADNMEGYEILREEDLNTKIESAKERIEILTRKSDTSSNFLGKIITGVGDVISKLKLADEKLEALQNCKRGLQEIKNHQDIIRNLTLADDEAIDPAIDEEVAGINIETVSVNDALKSSTKRLERLQFASTERLSVLNELFDDRSVTWGEGSGKFDEAIAGTENEIQKLSVKFNKGRNVLESASNKGQMILKRKDDMQRELHILNSERQLLIDHKLISQDSHNPTERPLAEDGRSLSRAEKILEARVRRNEESVASSIKLENLVFPKIEDLQRDFALFLSL